MESYQKKLPKGLFTSLSNSWTKYTFYKVAFGCVFYPLFLDLEVRPSPALLTTYRHFLASLLCIYILLLKVSGKISTFWVELYGM